MFSVTQKCKWATRSNIESDGASIFSDVRNALCVIFVLITFMMAFMVCL